MLIEFRAADRVLGFKALGIYQKGVEAAKVASEKVYVDTMALQTAESNTTLTTRWLGDLDEMEPGEARDVEIPHDLAQTLRTAASVYMTQLGKLAEKETDMLVPLDNTKDLMSQLRSLADRLSGQVEFAGVVGDAFHEVLHDAFDAAADKEGDDSTATVQFSSGGRTSKRVTMDALTRAADSLKAR